MCLRPSQALFAATLLVAVPLGGCLQPGPTESPDDGQTENAPAGVDVDTVEQQAYWYSRYNYNAMLLMTGLGERLTPSDQARQALAQIADFNLSKMPMNPYLLETVYASGDPHFQQEGNFSDLSTLNWNRSEMDKTLEPEAQAFTIAKITQRGLRTDYHAHGKDRFVALVQLREAQAMASTLHERLTTEEGLLATQPPDGTLQEPEPGEQIAGIWAYANLALLLSDPNLPLYQQLPDTQQAADRYQGWAADLFEASRELDPTSARNRALAIQAYGRLAAASEQPEVQEEALDALAETASALATADRPDLAARAWTVYGLGQAGAVTGNTTLTQQAQQVFLEEIEPRWDPDAGAYATTPDSQRYTYTPERTAAVVAALQTMRLIATPGVGAQMSAEEIDQRYATFVRTVLVDAGMQQAHAIPLAVHPAYREQNPRKTFTAPSVPLSTDGDGPYGLCPVYAAQVSYQEGDWQVEDRRFQTSEAMLLATLSTWSHRSNPDGFLPLSDLQEP